MSDGRKGMIGAAQPVTEGVAIPDLRRLLQEREAARREKDYTSADRIRNELKQKGVTVDDRTQIWQSIDGRSGPMHEYGNVVYGAGEGPGSGGGGGGGGYNESRPGEPPSDGELHALLEQRESARKGRDYATSDRIRDDLRARGYVIPVSCPLLCSPPPLSPYQS